jgi:hypothetical protein
VQALYLLTPLASQPLDILASLIPCDRTGCSYNLARSVTNDLVVDNLSKKAASCISRHYKTSKLNAAKRKKLNTYLTLLYNMLSLLLYLLSDTESCSGFLSERG